MWAHSAETGGCETLILQATVGRGFGGDPGILGFVGRMVSVAATQLCTCQHEPAMTSI